MYVASQDVGVACECMKNILPLHALYLLYFLLLFLSITSSLSLVGGNPSLRQTTNSLVPPSLISSNRRPCSSVAVPLSCWKRCLFKCPDKMNGSPPLLLVVATMMNGSPSFVSALTSGRRSRSATRHFWSGVEQSRRSGETASVCGPQWNEMKCPQKGDS